MERQLAREDSYDAVPEVIAAPDILGDFIVWNVAHWDYWTIRNQPSSWLTKLQMANAESSRVQAELYDDRYRVEPTGSAGSEPISDAELAELRASNPRFAKLPEAALKKLFAHKRK